MGLGERKDPYAAFNFLVEIDGITKAGFSEVSGLDSETEVFDYKEGGVNEYLHRLPAQTKHSNIVLKNGITDSQELWEWRNKAALGKIERKTGSIVLLNEAREEKMRWNFREGWPSKWSGPELKADGNEVAIETLEIVHEGIELG
jgi:phage tail-like protein